MTAKDIPIKETDRHYVLTFPNGTRRFSKDKSSLREVRLFRDGYLFATNGVPVAGRR